ncbi:MAG: B12-binding domain-containing radical SAM protein, partial [Magnetococcales bacterium]|nr:B12-binding domain-containing radical SAM protein [Magnetococcales bacterium]
MKIGLIAMSGVRVKNPELAAMGLTLPQFVERGKVVASLPSLGLLTVAALTPEGIDVSYLEMAELPSEGSLEDFDLVGISSYTAQIDEAYALADRYRSRQTPVVLGGLHVSLMPDEASLHADAIVIGSAEETWPRLIEDFMAGDMKPRYNGAGDNVFSPGLYAKPRFDLLKGRSYNRLTVQTSRGCPRECEFCASSNRISPRFQQKPIAQVIAEIETAKNTLQHPFFELADDNSFLDKGWSRNFLKAVAPLNIHWFTECDISVADDLDLLDLLAKSGCKQILIGLESPMPGALHSIDPRGWKQRCQGRYLEAIERIQSRGITVNGCFVLGLDADTPETFPALRDFIRKSGLLEVQLTVLTPFPNTPLYERLKREGRLLAERYWERCTLFDVNFQPKNM